MKAAKHRASPRPTAPPPTSRLATALLWAGVAWLVWVLFAYTSAIGRLSPFFDALAFGIPSGTALWRDVRAVGTWMGAFGGALSIGLWLTRRVPFESALQRLVLGGGAGIGALSYLSLILGLAQGYRPGVLQGLWVALAAAALVGFKQMDWAAVRGEWKAARAASTPLITWTLYLVLATGFVMAFVPEIFYDSLVYHLGAPRWYLLEGGIRDFPNLHTKFPLLVQMLYVPVLPWGGEAAAKLTHWMFVPLTGLLFVDAARRWGRPRAGMLGALMFISIPMGQLVSWTTGIDMGASFYVLGLLILMVDLLRLPESGTAWLVLMGVYGGFSFAVKYPTAMAFLAAYAILIGTSLAKKRPLARVAKDALVIGGVATLMVLPWFLKNWLHTGNPLFPFLVGLFGGRGLDPDRFPAWMNQNAGYTPKTLVEILRLPWTLTFDQLSGLSLPGPWILATSPLVLVLLSRRPGWAPARWLFGGAFLCVAAMTFSSRHTRYSLPFMAPLLLAIAWSLTDDERLRYGRWFVPVAALLTAWLNIGSAFAVMSSYRPFDVLMGRESPTDYVSYTHPGMNPLPSTRMFDWMGTHLPKGARVFIFGDEQIANCPIPFEVAGVFDTPRPLVWMQGLSDPEALYERIRARGITHIFVNWGCALRNLGYRVIDWPEDRLALFCDFWDRHVRPAHQEMAGEKFFDSKNPLWLFAVVPEGEARETPPPFNPFLALYEQRFAEAPEAKRALYERLASQYPKVATFQQRRRDVTRPAAAAPAR